MVPLKLWRTFNINKQYVSFGASANISLRLYTLISLHCVCMYIYIYGCIYIWTLFIHINESICAQRCRGLGTGSCPMKIATFWDGREVLRPCHWLLVSPPNPHCSRFPRCHPKHSQMSWNLDMHPTSLGNSKFKITMNVHRVQCYRLLKAVGSHTHPYQDHQKPPNL